MFGHIGTRAEACRRVAEKAEWEGSAGRTKYAREATIDDLAWYEKNGPEDVDLIEDKKCPECGTIWPRSSPWCYDGRGCGHKFDPQ